MIGIFAIGVLGVTGACASQGNLTKLNNKHDADMAAERAARDSDAARGNAADLALARDIAALRGEVGVLRTQYGAKITMLENQITFALPITFDFDNSAVRPRDNPALERFATVAEKYYDGSQVTIQGFADPAGSQGYNLRLSQQRADNVRGYLISRGMRAELVHAVGFGEARQAVAGAKRDDPGAEQNRRVEFVIVTKGAATVASARAVGSQ
jgi:peptidoglycan-associated lipoprotein